MTTPRAQKRQALEAQILTLGREQLATVGAAALSLRAIARELGIVSSAIYRYIDDRDELLTRLVVEAFDDLGDAVDARCASVESDDSRGRVAAVAHAFREWAIAEPARFALLYGSPVPGYSAPAERTVEPGTRVIVHLLRILDDAAAAGRLADVGGDVNTQLATDFTALRAEQQLALSDSQCVFAVGLWTWLIGTTSQEVFGGFGADTFGAPDALFDSQLTQQLDRYLV